MDVILPAGATLSRKDPLFALSQGGYKEMLNLAGKPMIQWVLDVLTRSQLVEQVVVAGLPITSDLNCSHSFEILDVRGSILDNVCSGAQKLLEGDHSENVLILSADLPLITLEGIEWLIRAADESECELCIPMIEKKIFEGRFPGVRKNTLRFKELELSGADTLIVRTEIAAQNSLFSRRIIEARQDPLKQAALLGYDTMLMLALRQLKLEELDHIMSKRLGIKSKFLLCPFPEITMDVDKPAEFERVSVELARR
jgi:CTP:molybdopterin cytidylyltransferase MocA